jgi:hypothetical protein
VTGPLAFSLTFGQLSAGANRHLEFPERSQPFIRSHNETFSVVAMCVNNDGCFPRCAEHDYAISRKSLWTRRC